MARVNLEDRFFGEGRLLHFAKLLKISTHEAIGILAYLWHDSQELGLWEGTSEDVSIWCRLDEISDRESYSGHVRTTSDVLIDALIRARYIVRLDTDRYEIKGNKDQLDAIEFYKNRAQRAAQARWQEKPENRTSDATSIESSIAQTSDKQSPSMQCNSMQDKENNNARSRERLSFDLEALYRKYPRKEGKKRGMQVVKRVVTNEQRYSELSKAIDRYTEHIRKSGTEPQFIKHFATFMHSWEDWCDPETGKVDATGPPAQVLSVPDAESTRKYLAEQESMASEPAKPDPRVRQLIQGLMKTL